MYHLYILECADRSLYTGITLDLVRRVKEHNGFAGGRGAKYTRGRRPVKIVFSRKFRNRSGASIEEARIKKLPRKDKINMIKLNVH